MAGMVRISEGIAVDLWRVFCVVALLVVEEGDTSDVWHVANSTEKQSVRLRDGWLDTWSLTGEPPKLPQGTTPVQLGAWTALSRVLLNLDEVLTKR